jgi:DNA polymerase III epsilon subunit-like protein
MYYLLFDTETTGMGSKDEVIQFTGLLLRDLDPEELEEHRRLNKKSAPIKMLKLYNFYCDTTRKIDSGAYKVHGIDKALLKELSEGHTFEDNFLSMINFLKGKDVCWIAYNVAFDKRLINQTLSNNNLPKFNFGKNLALLSDVKGTSNFCLMRGVTGLSKKGERNLGTVANDIYDDNTIRKLFEVFSKKAGIEQDIDYHNAIFDVFVSYLIFSYYFYRLRG